MNLGIDQGIASIILALRTILMPNTKEVITDAVSGSACIIRTPYQGSRKGFYGSTPGNIRNTVSAVEPPSSVLIVIVGNSPPCGLNVIQDVENNGNPLPQDLSDNPNN